MRGVSRVDEQNMRDRRHRLVFDDFLEAIKAHGARRENFDDDARVAHGHFVPSGLTAFDRHVRAAVVAGRNAHNEIAGRWPARPAAKLIAQRADDVHDGTIMHLRSTGHHLERQDRKTVDQLVEVILLLLPGEEFVLAHPLQLGLGHRRFRLLWARTVTLFPPDNEPAARRRSVAAVISMAEKDARPAEALGAGHMPWAASTVRQALVRRSRCSCRQEATRI